eukprot:1475516-Pyramimonas_sp.AAC.1
MGDTGSMPDILAMLLWADGGGRGTKNPCAIPFEAGIKEAVQVIEEAKEAFTQIIQGKSGPYAEGEVGVHEESENGVQCAWLLWLRVPGRYRCSWSSTSPYSSSLAHSFYSPGQRPSEVQRGRGRQQELSPGGQDRVGHHRPRHAELRARAEQNQEAALGREAQGWRE